MIFAKIKIIHYIEIFIICFHSHTHLKIFNQKRNQIFFLSDLAPTRPNMTIKNRYFGDIMNISYLWIMANWYCLVHSLKPQRISIPSCLDTEDSFGSCRFIQYRIDQTFIDWGLIQNIWSYQWEKGQKEKYTTSKANISRFTGWTFFVLKIREKNQKIV